MIRWHSRSDRYMLEQNTPHVRQSDTVRKSLLIPVLSSRSETARTHAHGLDDQMHLVEETQVVRDSRTTLCLGIAQGQYDDQSSRSRVQRLPAGQLAPLPVLYLPGTHDAALGGSPLVEGVCTGLVNSTSGMVVGAAIGVGVSLVLGPVSLPFWAIFGGVTAGTMSGTAQTAVILSSNETRRFAQACNDFLLTARAEGLTPAALRQMRVLHDAAETEEMRRLLEDVLNSCEASFGAEATAQLRAA